MNLIKSLFSVLLVGSIALLPATILAGPGGPTGKVRHDYNDDGFSDIHYLPADNLLFQLQQQNLTIQAGSTSVFPTPAGWSILADGDFDNTGSADMLYLEGASQNLFELLLNGTTILPGSTTVFTMPAGWTVESTGDYNNDGFVDILLNQGGGSNLLFILFVQGTTVQAGSTTVFQMPAGWSVIGSGDLNNDGFDDIVFNTGTSIFGLLIQGTTIQPGSTTIFTLPAGVTAVALANFDNLNGIDIMVQDSNNVLSALLLDTNGTTLLGTSGVVFDATGFNVRASGDYNNDSFGDVLLEDASLGAFGLLLNGTTILGTSTTIWNAPAGWVITPDKI